MAILASDIKILESERMSDTTDGGGRRTSREVVDGEAGNIFPKLSRADVTKGRVNMRKVFPSVRTANLDTYGGAHLIVSSPPSNAKVHVTLFSTASETDTRSAARDRIESYVAAGPESRLVLIGRQLAGQQSVVAYQRVEAPLPEVGDVMCLSTEEAGVVTAQQYFRVQSVNHEVQTFTEQIGTTVVEFERRVVTLGTGASLRHEFNGPESPSQLTSTLRPTRLRTTSFVDAARYYGIRPLAAAVSAGALSLRVDSIYSQLVPTATRETALANTPMDSVGGLLATATALRNEVLATAGWPAGQSRRALRAIEPGSVTLAAAGMASVSDDGAGTIEGPGFAGTVDYDTGVISRTGGSSGAATWTLSYRPAVRATQIAHTRETYVTAANRGLVYIFTLSPLPAPGAVNLSFRAQSKWYQLSDDGAGVVRGDQAAFGAGTIDYTTGVMTVTLGALPDIGSSLLLAFASPAHYVIRAGGTADAGPVEQRIVLDGPIQAGSLDIVYTAGGTDYTAADNSGGAISGDGLTGTVDYTAGVLLLRYTTRLPDALSTVRVEYNKISATTPGEQVARTVTVVAAASMALGGGAVANTVTGSVPFGGKGLMVKDNGAGLLVVLGGQALGAAGGLEAATVSGDQVVGTVDYATGATAITSGVVIAGRKWEPVLVVTGVRPYNDFSGRYEPIYGPAPSGEGEWVEATATVALSSGSASFGFQASGVSASAALVQRAVSFTDAPLRLALLASVGDKLVPGGSILRIGGLDYIDRNGTLYAGVSPDTGVGTSAGTINYDAGTLTLSYWAPGASAAVSVLAGLSVYGEASCAEVSQRTAGAPLRPGSFFISATSVTGEALSGQANSAGEITGIGVEGYVDQLTGIYRARFGELVAAAGNESAWWFDAANVVAGQVWRPTLVVPSSVRYNAVVLTSIPLNADLIGLDAVRLPSDGKVPVVRVGDLGVVHNVQSAALPNPPTAGATYSVGRDDVSEIWLEDQAGKKVAPTQYSYSLDDGTVTMAGALALSGYTQPLKAMSRISDMVLISDAQIDGAVAFDPPLARDYPAAGSYLSTALEFGDVVARVTNVRDQQTVTGWDAAGAGATAEYNVIDYPIEVLNNGAVSERWRISFQTTTTFQVIGESLGVIAAGTTSTDCQPTNALTGLPYFTIRAAGWGTGWSAGNQLFFDTVSAAPPAWIVRTAVPGASVDGDAFSLQYRGDADAE